MEPPRSLDELQNFLDTGGDVNFYFPALYGAGSWTLLQRTAVAGTLNMVALLLERGASMKYLTKDKKLTLDLACDAENWDSFELLQNAAVNQYPLIRSLYSRKGANPLKFFLLKFFITLRGLRIA